MVDRRDRQLEWELDYKEAKETLAVLSGLPRNAPTAEHRNQILGLLGRACAAVQEAQRAM